MVSTKKREAGCLIQPCNGMINDTTLEILLSSNAQQTDDVVEHYMYREKEVGGWASWCEGGMPFPRDVMNGALQRSVKALLVPLVFRHHHKICAKVQYKVCRYLKSRPLSSFTVHAHTCRNLGNVTIQGITQTKLFIVNQKTF